MWKAVRPLAAAAVALVLWGCGDPKAQVPRVDEVAQWLVQLTRDDPGVRRRAVESLGRTWPEGARAVPALSEALDDEDEGVRKAAAASLEQLARRGWQYLHGFLRDEKDPEQQALLQATNTVRNLGAVVTPGKAVEVIRKRPRAGVVLMVGLGLDQRPRNRANRWLLGFLGRCADPIYRDALAIEDPKWPDTAAAAAALAGEGALPPSEDRSAPESLRLLSEDRNEDLAAFGQVVLYLWRGLPADPDAAPQRRDPEPDFDALVEEIRRHQRPSPGAPPSTDVHRVLQRLAALAPDLTAVQQERLVGTLVDGWGSDLFRGSRIPIVQILGDLGPKAAAAVPLIAEDLEESEAVWRRYLTQGEGEARAGDLVGLHLELGPTFSRTLERRLADADALGGIGRPAAEAVPLLRRLAEESDPALRYVAARSLRRIGAPAEEASTPGR